MAKFEVTWPDHDSGVSIWSIVRSIFTVVIAFALMCIIFQRQLPRNDEIAVDHANDEDGLDMDSGSDGAIEDDESDGSSEVVVVDFETEAEIIKSLKDLNDFEIEAARLRATWRTV